MMDISKEIEAIGALHQIIETLSEEECARVFKWAETRIKQKHGKGDNKMGFKA